MGRGISISGVVILLTFPLAGMLALIRAERLESNKKLNRVVNEVVTEAELRCAEEKDRLGLDWLRKANEAEERGYAACSAERWGAAVGDCDWDSPHYEKCVAMQAAIVEFLCAVHPEKCSQDALGRAYSSPAE